MACACKTLQQYSNIQKQYGVGNKPTRNETHIIDITKKMLLTLMLYLIMIPFLPIALIYVICHRNKPIQINNFFKFKNGKHK